MGCISSSYCNRRNNRNLRQNNCNTNSLSSSLNQIQLQADTSQNQQEAHQEHNSPTFSNNNTSNSYHSSPSTTTNQINLSYIPPTGKNKRLKPNYNKYFKSDKRISESQLKSKRDEFWHTAPAFEGKPEIWDALKAAVDALENKNLQLAQAIIDSANIILPNGQLSDCYDELGNRYQIPIYVLAKPINLVKSSKSKQNNELSSNEQESSASFKEERKAKKCKNFSSDEEDDIKEIKEKLDKINNTENDLQIKLRISTFNQDINNNDVKMVINPNETVSSLKHKISNLTKIDSKLQRCYFGGKQMRDKDKLKLYKLKKNVVVQVIVKQTDDDLNNTKQQLKQHQANELNTNKAIPVEN